MRSTFSTLVQKSNMMPFICDTYNEILTCYFKNQYMSLLVIRTNMGVTQLVQIICRSPVACAILQ